ncbi:[NiFe]-hydrogenase assembly chaperone HybE [uncultured Rhodoblastus sp.]|uniref:[NiFe]-hydrogenase assembly chaperone HybE n=1 Tax=uncultured Rhodoblastus sp. TaxID=543037 RepID=UPI0025DBCD88|nr:[NiFe]-hydrogenase assembly chaperone HybE [uncultured Rhodoblastus sp.]
MGPEAEAADFSARLEAYFDEVHRRAMADAPICNKALAVAGVGFRPWRGQALGIVVTPWFMNIVLVPLQDSPPIPAAAGEKQSVSLPCGKVDFLVADLEGLGRLLVCSLFSPMQDFVDQEAALATARAAVAALMDEGALAQAPEPEIYPFAPDAPRETPAERAEEYRRRESAEVPRMDRRAFFLRGGEKARAP